MSDPTATFRPLSLLSPWLEDSPIEVVIPTRYASGEEDVLETNLSPREARVLASQLVSAADEAEKAVTK